MEGDANVFDTLHAAHNAVFGDVQGANLPLGYGDFAGEVAAIKTGLGVLDPGVGGVILVRGGEAEVFLNGLTTNDVKSLGVGQVQSSLICGTKGKILWPLEVIRLTPDQFLVVTLPGQFGRVAGHLEAYHVREAVEIGQVPLVRLDLLGPQVEPALKDLGHSFREPFGVYHDAPVITLSHPLGVVPRALAFMPGAVARDWLNALLEQSPAARLVGFEAMEEVRIQAGIPRFGPDYGEEHLPGEASLYSHLSFNKGCYVGQEIHARQHYRGHVNRKLYGVAIPEAEASPLAPGAELFRGDRSVGTLTSLARTEIDGLRRGIARLRYEDASEGPLLSTAPGAVADIRLFTLATDLGAVRP